MQSNINRLRKILKCTKILLYISAVLTIFLNIRDINWVSSIISGIWIVISIAWWLFDKYLWKKKWLNSKLRLLLKDFYCPAICGRWEGTLTRDGKKHKFVIEIKQTYTSIACTTYSQNGQSRSKCAELLYDQQNDSYSLVYFWTGKTAKDPSGKSIPSNDFDGLTKLEINDECTQLSGHYFTDRSPNQTKGEILLSNRQEQLKNSF